MERPMRSTVPPHAPPTTAALATLGGLATLALATLLTVALAPAAGAQASTAAIAAPVTAADVDAGESLSTLAAGIGYVDADGDGQPDMSVPDEPVYLDVDGSQTVSFADVRLTGFGNYVAGSQVALTNQDLGLPLRARGAFGSVDGAWYADTDGSTTVSAGDVRITPSFGGKVAASDGQAGASLGNVNSAPRMGFLDLDDDLRYDSGETLFIDVEAQGTPDAGRISAGDLRMHPLGFAADDAPTRGEFEDLQRSVGLDPAGEGGDGVIVRTDVDEASSAWTAPVVLAFLLGVANIVGLGVVYSMMRRTQRPRNPFK